MHARLTCTTLERLRNDESFSLLWSKVSALRDKHQVNAAELPRRRKVPQRIEIGTGQGTHPASVQDCFMPSISKYSILPWLVSGSALTSQGIRLIVT